MSHLNLLTPGQKIRPPMDEQTAIALVENLFALRVKEIRELNSYDDRNYHVYCEEDHNNPSIDRVSEHGYVLKVLNLLGSKSAGFVEAQNKMMSFLALRGFGCPTPVRSDDGSTVAPERLPSDSNDVYLVRLLVYRPGTLLHEVKLIPELSRDIGLFTAKLHKALKEFTHRPFVPPLSIWMLSEVPRLRDFVSAVTNTDDRAMVLKIVEAFESRVLPIASQLERGKIHGDINEQNILVNSEGTKVTGIIDFGDTHEAPFIYELAIVICYMTIQARDLRAARHVIEGYETLTKVQQIEKDILKICVCARLCQSLVLGAYSHVNDPQNDYLLVTQKPGWDILRELWPLEDKEVLKLWGIDTDTIRDD